MTKPHSFQTADPEMGEKKLSLIVKGNKFEAARAAAARGIAFAFVREVKGFQTVGLSSEAQRDKIASWFGEAPLEAPFPIGTLLHYHERE